MNLASGIEQLGLALPTGVVEQMAAYLALLAKWNKTYNLTAIRDPAEMVTHHLLDSLAVLPVLQKSALAGRHLTSMTNDHPQKMEHPHHACSTLTMVDVGSGAGLPGLVIAMACPEWSVTSVEAVEKKAAFQRQAVIELGLKNVQVLGGRVEMLSGSFDAVISRAFASLEDFVKLAGHLSGTLWAMKGAYPAGEIAALPGGWQLTETVRLDVPGLAAERHLLQLEKT